MYLPGSASKEIMVIATFDRSTPKEDSGLRSGFFMSIFGVVAAIFGAIFQEKTETIGFIARYQYKIKREFAIRTDRQRAPALI